MEEPPERGDAPPLYAPIDPAPNPEEWYSVRERNRILREAVAKLWPKLREIVEVHGLNDNSIQKTADTRHFDRGREGAHVSRQNGIAQGARA